MSKNTKVTAEQFVTAYIKNGTNLQKMADELGLAYANAYARLKNYRKKGVKLPVPRKRSSLIDVVGLNNLIKELRA